MDTKKKVTKTSKELGVLRGGQITAIVGWALAILFGILLLIGTTSPFFDSNDQTFGYVLSSLFIVLPSVAFILTLVGWNRYGASIAAGVLYIISAVALFLSVLGIISAVLVLVGGILILCGAGKLK